MYYYPSIVTDNIFPKYIAKINKFPLLTSIEENRLLRQYLVENNLTAAHKLITSHLRLVVSIAIKFRNYGLPIMDLIAEGNIGLMKAIKKFELRKGTRLSTYAMWWIKAMIQDYILRSWSMLKISAHVLQKRLFSNFAKLKEKIAYNNKNINDVFLQTISLNNKIASDTVNELIDTIADQRINQEDKTINKQEYFLRSNALKRAFSILNEREKKILFQRKLSENPQTLDQLSKEFMVSSERIRQIENVALKKIRKYICCS